MLEQAGRKNVTALLGGFAAWAGAGHPVVTGDTAK
jgi:rhodanese-related sulfurtransferase